MEIESICYLCIRQTAHGWHRAQSLTARWRSLPICKVGVAIPQSGKLSIMSEKITHSGIVDSIGGGRVMVRITQTSACASCKVAGHCNASESKEKIIDVGRHGCRGELKVGDVVMVTVSRKVAAQALLLGFGVPFVILVAVLFAVVLATSDETTGALSAIGALIPYYIALFLVRDKIRGKMSFEVEKVPA